ncbi:hypothetical protein J0H58_11900 [bacterium]|nr:hypothetical protein [bacterium]
MKKGAPFAFKALLHAALLSLAGCVLFGRDQFSAGVYRMETAGVIGCEVAATAVEREGKLRLDGFIRGARLTGPAEGEVEVRLRTPDGKQKSVGRFPLRLVNHRRTSHSHPRFEAVLQEVPPPGIVVMFVPTFSLCTPVAVNETASEREIRKKRELESQ